jgi:2-oxoglutarate dehydrogenase E1 component
MRVIDDSSVAEWREDISRLVVCSGKVYYDLQRHPERARADEVAIVRLEQLYPFPLTDMSELIGRYPNVETVVWAQEEPTNMGPWRPLRHRLEAAVDGRATLQFAGRPWRASPSEGYYAAHAEEQLRISSVALGLN